MSDAAEQLALLADPTSPRLGHPDPVEPTGEAQAPEAPARLVVVASGAEDLTLCGLRFTPDLDALARIPALADPAGGPSAQASGTGVVGELLRSWDALPPWFRPDDLDLARAVVRTRRLAAGATPSEISAGLTPERAGVRLLPMTDRPVEAHVVLESADDPDGRVAVHAASWASAAGSESGLTPVQVSAAGLTEATPAPGVLDAVRTATSITLPLTAPVTGLGVMLGLPGLRDALRGTFARVVGAQVRVVDLHLTPTRLDRRPDRELRAAGGAFERAVPVGDALGGLAPLAAGREEELTKRTDLHGGGLVDVGLPDLGRVVDRNRSTVSCTVDGSGESHGIEREMAHDVGT